MTTHKNYDRDYIQQLTGRGSSKPVPSSDEMHVDLENSSPTDSRADEKVIVNDRVEHAPSLVNAVAGNNNLKEEK
jgi:hypothetical protein